MFDVDVVTAVKKTVNTATMKVITLQIAQEMKL